MKLSEMQIKNRIKSAKRLGRGRSSGKGKTSTRGHKGQKSRSGHNIPRRFEGGQMPLVQRLPKVRGFKSYYLKPAVINLDQLEKNYKSGEIVSLKTLLSKKIIKNNVKKVKLLGRGKLTKELKFDNILMSKSVQNKIKAKDSVEPKK